MIKEVTEAKALMSEGFSFKVKAGNRWYLERDKSKAQRVHKNVIRVLRNEGKASFEAPMAVEESLFSILRNPRRGTTTSSVAACVAFLSVNGVSTARKAASPFIDNFGIKVAKIEEKLANRLLFGSAESEKEKWLAAERHKAKLKARREARAATKKKRR